MGRVVLVNLLKKY